VKPSEQMWQMEYDIRAYQFGVVSSSLGVSPRAFVQRPHMVADHIVCHLWNLGRVCRGIYACNENEQEIQQGSSRISLFQKVRHCQESLGPSVIEITTVGGIVVSIRRRRSKSRRRKSQPDDEESHQLFLKSSVNNLLLSVT
jgi:hypothetical protein